MMFMLCSHAWGQGTPADKAAAEALFQQGQKLLDEQRTTEACEKFRASQQLDAGLGTMLYLADCYEQSGRTASAWATFEEAASLAASRGESSREQIARVRADALKPRLSRVIIRSPEFLPPDATISRDGSIVPNALFGVAIPVDPGTVRVQVNAAGFEPLTVTVEVPPNAPKPVEITLSPLKQLPQDDTTSPEPLPPNRAEPQLAHSMLSTSAAAPSSDLSTEQAAAFVLGGVGLVAAGLATVFTVVGSSKHDDSLAHCSKMDGNSCDPDGMALREEALDNLDVATVFGVIGAAALSTGVALYVAFPSEQADSHSNVGLTYSGTW